MLFYFSGAYVTPNSTEQQGGVKREYDIGEEADTTIEEDSGKKLRMDNGQESAVEKWWRVMAICVVKNNSF